MFIMNVQHVLTLVPGLEVASWATAVTGNLEPQEDSKAPSDTVLTREPLVFLNDA